MSSPAGRVDRSGPPADRPEQHRVALLHRAGTGDQQAFAELYDQIAPVVYGVALRVLRDRDLAAETAQEVLLEIWEIAARFDPAQGTVLGWSAAIGRRRAIDSVRAVEAQRQRDSRAGLRDMGTAFDDVAEAVIATDEAREVRDCLSGLAEEERDLVFRAYYRGRTYRQVAEDTGTPVGTVKSRIRSGLGKLARCLGRQ